MITPDLGEEPLAADDFAGAFEQVVQELELAIGEIDQPIAELRLATRNVERERAGAQDLSIGRVRGTPQMDANPCEQLESTLEREEQFLHDASHELRTPVTIARGHLEVLGRSNGRNAPETAVALDELSRMERILDRLLLLARADQPDFLELEQIELDHFLEDIFLRWSEIAPRSWRLGALAHGTLHADPEQLRIALDALIENAVKYSEPGGRIELSSRATGSKVVIEVDDEGIGVPDEALARIFERFARSDPARTRTAGGVGLGLAIVDTIVKAHGGRCLVSRMARGSVFGIQLPGFTVAWPSLQSAVARSAGASS